MHTEPLTWQRVEWKQGDGRYVYEVLQGGLHARLSSPHGTSLTLPTIAWEGLLDALAAARKTRGRSERETAPRAFARWGDAEATELRGAFAAGRSIKQLAAMHNRTPMAIEAQLERMGLWDRVEGRPTTPRREPGEMPRMSDFSPQADAARSTRPVAASRTQIRAPAER